MALNTLFFVFFFLLGSVSAYGTPPDYKELINGLQKRYEATTDIQADFVQEIYSQANQNSIKATGRAFFKKPQLMRWEYLAPEPQLIVAGGNEVYIYEKEAEQVMIIPREQFLSTEISKAFFFGTGDFERYFIIKMPAQTREKEGYLLLLIPKKETPQVKEIQILVTKDTKLIKEMWISDQFDSITHLIFKNIKCNQGIKRELFQFSPPEGVEIFRADDLNKG